MALAEVMENQYSPVCSVLCIMILMWRLRKFREGNFFCQKKKGKAKQNNVRLYLGSIKKKKKKKTNCLCLPKYAGSQMKVGEIESQQSRMCVTNSYAYQLYSPWKCIFLNDCVVQGEQAEPAKICSNIFEEL